MIIKTIKFKIFSLIIIALLFLYPNNANAQKDTITIGAYINSLYDFNLTENSYKTEFWLWMKYNATDKIDSIQNQIEFINAKNSPHIQAASTNKKGNINWFGAKYIGEFQKSWDVTSFPFDKQKLKITIESGEYNSNKIFFKSDNINSKLNESFKKKHQRMGNYRL